MTKGSALLAGYSNHYDSELRKNNYSGDRREKTRREKEVVSFFLYISQNFIMARFAAFEGIKLHQILKPASTSP